MSHSSESKPIQAYAGDEYDEPRRLAAERRSATRARSTRHSMPMTPPLLRTSAPSEEETLMDRMREVSSEFPRRVLADILGCSEDTASRRRAGRGWSIAEMLVLCDHMGITPSELFKPRTRRELRRSATVDERLRELDQ